MNLVIPQCDYCNHYREHQKCDAYPEGIPEEILLNKVDHRKPYQGDRGIQFEKMKLKYNNRQSC
jgi:hypothetical protein